MDDLYQLSRHFLKSYYRPYRRYFLKTQSLDSRFSIITGQRGVGKSTAMVQFLSNYCGGETSSKKILYVQADHFITSKYSLYEIAEDFANYGGELICFDEVHKYVDWSRELKSIYDTFTELKIVASGSSILEVQKGSHDLSRRAVVYKVTGMSFREFIELHKGLELKTYTLDQILTEHESITPTIIARIENKGQKILPLFDNYLMYGYYPYFLDYNDISLFHITLEQQIHTTIESDLVAVYQSLAGESIRKLKKLLSVIAISVPFTPDLSKLMKMTNIGDARTLKTYLKYLEDGGILLQFEKSGKPSGRLEKPEKLYLNNTNQLFALAGMKDINHGTLRESFFANILSFKGQLAIPKKGDFLFDNKFLFEIGGKNKTARQIAGMNNAYLALDNIEHGFGNKIPLWLFGFIY